VWKAHVERADVWKAQVQNIERLISEAHPELKYIGVSNVEVFAKVIKEIVRSSELKEKRRFMCNSVFLVFVIECNAISVQFPILSIFIMSSIHFLSWYQSDGSYWRLGIGQISSSESWLLILD